MNDKKTNKLVWGLIAAAVMVILSAVGFILALTGVFEINGFLLGFMILSAGLGLVFFVYGLTIKGGYEMATGYILIIVGITLLLVAVKLKWYGIVFIDIALALLGFVILLLLKSKSLIVERTDEKAGYKSFNEQKAEAKAKEEEEEKKRKKEEKKKRKEEEEKKAKEEEERKAKEEEEEKKRKKEEKKRKEEERLKKEEEEEERKKREEEEKKKKEEEERLRREEEERQKKEEEQKRQEEE